MVDEFMIGFILALLVILWLLGFIHIAILESILFSISQHPFTLHSLLLIILIFVVVKFLPGIFQAIVLFILFFWLLSLFGVIAIGGLSNILIILLLLAVVFSLF